MIKVITPPGFDENKPYFIIDCEKAQFMANDVTQCFMLWRSKYYSPTHGKVTGCQSVG